MKFDVEGRPTAPSQQALREHELKTWPDYFKALVSGAKTFEYRRNDRDFRDGDVLWLREWEPLKLAAGETTCGRYTGREMRRRVTYMLAVGNGFVIMALGDAGIPGDLSTRKETDGSVRRGMVDR